MIQVIPTVSLAPWEPAEEVPFPLQGIGSLVHAKTAGCKLVDIFPENAGSFTGELDDALGENGLSINAIGTGAGGRFGGIPTLTDPDAGNRSKARDFIISLIKVAEAKHANYVIIGSLQGSNGTRNKAEVRGMLHKELKTIGQEADESGVTVLFEPLNSHESKLFAPVRDRNFFGPVVEFIDGLPATEILLDVYHLMREGMSPETTPANVRVCEDKIGLVHWASQHRFLPGNMEYAGSALSIIATVLKAIGYDKCISFESYPGENPGPDFIEAKRHLDAILES